jgi:hypothetical protein
MKMTYFNHDLIRKYIVIFGSIFDNVSIIKYETENIRSNKNDSENLLSIKEINVPITYANKNKYILRYLKRGNDSTDIKDVIQKTLPRMAFEFTNVYYDSKRKLNRNYKIISTIDDDNTLIHAQFTPVPYNIDVELSVLVNKTEDGTKIVEQILPYFTPQLNITSNLIPDNNIKLDIPIVLNSVYLDEEYETDFRKNRVVTWGLNFTIKGYFFSPINTEKVVTDITTTLNDTSLTIQPYPTDSLFTDDYGFLIE